MKWRKLGLVLDLESYRGIGLSYAQVPTPVVLSDRVRVFFATRRGPDRDGAFVSHIARADFSREDPRVMLDVDWGPLVALGRAGTFDEFGMIPFSVERSGGRLLLYYGGWQRLRSVPYKTEIGCLSSDDWGRTFQRTHDGPILPTAKHDAVLVNAPQLFATKERTYLFYASGMAWIDDGKRREVRYRLKRAERNRNGGLWNSEDYIVPVKTELECQTRCAILESGSFYEMLFSYRNCFNFRNREGGYRIGYAWSWDLDTWHRDDERTGIDISSEGWDSEMIEYPAIFEINGETYMLYNGNKFGERGFGLSILDG